MDNTSVTQFTPRSEQQVAHTPQTKPLQFRNENDRELYEKFKDRCFENDAWSMINRLRLTAQLLMDALFSNDEENYMLGRRDAYGLQDLLSETAKLFEDLEESGVLGENWMSPFRCNDSRKEVSNA